METPRAAGVQEKAIAVAVKKSPNSQQALKWTVDNLMNENQNLTVVHVVHTDNFIGGADKRKHGKLKAICGPEIAKGLEEGHKENIARQAREIFNPLQFYCKKKKVHCDEVILEDENVQQALADFVLQNNIDVLVVGSGPKGGIRRKLKGLDTAQKISKNMPYFCAVYTVHRGGLISMKPPSSTAQMLSLPHSVHAREPEICIQSLNTQLETKISANSGESPLAVTPRVNEFEFRSPLKDCGDSDFTWIGQCKSDTDISFVGSYAPCYDLESHRLPTKNLGCGRGSSIKLSSTLDSPYKTMDESMRLPHELMHIKKVYGAECQASFDRKKALQTKFLKLEEDEGLNMAQGSPAALASLRSYR